MLYDPTPILREAWCVSFRALPSGGHVRHYVTSLGLSLLDRKGDTYQRKGTRRFPA